MKTRDTEQAVRELEGAGYKVGYDHTGSNKVLVLRQGNRVVTTLPVKDNGVDDESVAYLVSEGHYDLLGHAHG